VLCDPGRPKGKPGEIHGGMERILEPAGKGGVEIVVLRNGSAGTFRLYSAICAAF